MSFRSMALIGAMFALGLAGCEQKEPAAVEQDVKSHVAAAKKEATDAGKYDCCLKHPCNQCLVDMGMCPCEENLKAGKAVCSECKGGWMAGDGDVEGVVPDEVKAMPRDGGM